MERPDPNIFLELFETQSIKIATEDAWAGWLEAQRITHQYQRPKEHQPEAL